MPTIGKFVAILAPGNGGTHFAAKFAAKDIAKVQKAADAEKLCIVDPETQEIADLVARLPDGKLNGNKTPSIPAFKEPWPDAFSKLMAATPSDRAPAPSTKVNLWDELKVGSICVAHEGAEEGWWKARVCGISADGSKLTLKWVEAPKEPPVVRGRDQVAVLHPKFV